MFLITRAVRARTVFWSQPSFCILHQEYRRLYHRFYRTSHWHPWTKIKSICSPVHLLTIIATFHYLNFIFIMKIFAMEEIPNHFLPHEYVENTSNKSLCNCVIVFVFKYSYLLVLDLGKIIQIMHFIQWWCHPLIMLVLLSGRTLIEEINCWTTYWSILYKNQMISRKFVANLFQKMPFDSFRSIICRLMLFYRL